MAMLSWFETSTESMMGGITEVYFSVGPDSSRLVNGYRSTLEDEIVNDEDGPDTKIDTPVVCLYTSDRKCLNQFYLAVRWAEMVHLVIDECSVKCLAGTVDGLLMVSRLVSEEISCADVRHNAIEFALLSALDLAIGAEETDCSDYFEVDYAGILDRLPSIFSDWLTVYHLPIVTKTNYDGVKVS